MKENPIDIVADSNYHVCSIIHIRKRAAVSYDKSLMRDESNEDVRCLRTE